jgi:hypothetical protein
VVGGRVGRERAAMEAIRLNGAVGDAASQGITFVRVRRKENLL